MCLSAAPHSEENKFVMCLLSWHTAKAPIRRRGMVLPVSDFILPCAALYTQRRCSPCVWLSAHGEEGFAVRARHRQPLAVHHTRSSVCCVLFYLRRVPHAHGHLLHSGSELNYNVWTIYFNSCPAAFGLVEEVEAVSQIHPAINFLLFLYCERLGQISDTVAVSSLSVQVVDKCSTKL